MSLKDSEKPETFLNTRVKNEEQHWFTGSLHRLKNRSENLNQLMQRVAASTNASLALTSKEQQTVCFDKNTPNSNGLGACLKGLKKYFSPGISF